MFSSKKRYRASIVVFLIFVLGLLTPSSSTQAQPEGNPGILPSHSSAYGHSYGEWGAQWWQWALSIPAASNPVLDATGKYCGVGQSGPVWFLAGTFGGSVERTCTIPPGKALLLPVHNWIFGASVFDCDPTNPGVSCDVPTLQASAATAATSAEVLEVTIDGVAVNDTRNYRAVSPQPFSVTIPPGAVFGLPVGTYFPQVSDGYWLLLAPPRAGRHTIRVHAVNSAYGFEATVNYHLTVAP